MDGSDSRSAVDVKPGPSWPWWVVRLCFAIPFAWNVLCALQFIVAPADYSWAYQLSGVEGEVALRGLGVAFLMWNATYPPFLWRPECFVGLGAVIVAQQVIGLIGEIFILSTLPTDFTVLGASIQRFIIFDGAGLLLMVCGLILKGALGFRKRRRNEE